jgi:hypothetical protein
VSSRRAAAAFCSGGGVAPICRRQQFPRPQTPRTLSLTLPFSHKHITHALTSSPTLPLESIRRSNAPPKGSLARTQPFTRFSLLVFPSLSAEDEEAEETKLSSFLRRTACIHPVTTRYACAPTRRIDRAARPSRAPPGEEGRGRRRRRVRGRGKTPLPLSVFRARAVPEPSRAAPPAQTDNGPLARPISIGPRRLRVTVWPARARAQRLCPPFSLLVLKSFS